MAASSTPAVSSPPGPAAAGAPPGPAARPGGPRRWLRRVIVALAVLVVLVAAAWLAVPPIAKHLIETRLTEALGRPTTVGKVGFEPFSLRVTVNDLTVAGKTSSPLFAAHELTADVSAASLWHRAPVLDALRLVQPRIAIARDRDGHYDIDDLIERAQAPSDGPPPRFSLNNIEIVDGSIAFDDAAAGREHRIDTLAIGIPFLSTLPYQTAIRVTPHVEGNVNGAHFAVTGSATPFAEHREATLEVNLDNVALPQYLAYLPARPRVDLAQALASTRLTIAFIEAAKGERRLELRGEARLDDVQVKRRDGSPLLGAKRIAVTLDRVGVFGRDARIAKVAIEAPTVDVVRARDGTLELAQPLFDPTPPSRAAPAAPAAPWTVRVQAVAIERGSATLTDEGTAFRTGLADIALTASNVTNVPGEKARASASFLSADRIATFKAEAEADLLAPSATGSFSFTRFSLGLLFPYYKEALAADVQKGSLAFDGKFALTDGKFTLRDGSAAITDLAVAHPRSPRPFLRMPVVNAAGVGIDVAARRVEVASLDMREPAAEVVRERDGAIDVARIVRPGTATESAREDDAWILRIDRFRVERARLDVEDRMQQPPVRMTARDIDMTARDYSNARDAKVKVALTSRIGARGRGAWEGAVGTNPFSLAGTVDVTGLDLVPIRPYVESRVNVSLTGGSLAAKGRVTLNLPDKGEPRVTWKGNVAVTDFVALDKPTASDLARWKRLALDGVDVTSAPFRLSIDRIAAVDYYARVIVYQDGTLNLTRLLTPGAEPEPPPDAKPPPTAAAGTDEALPITLGRIELANGNVVFSDFFVRPNYSANLTEVTGSVSRMSKQDAGDVAITARVDHSAPVEIAGRIDPFASSLALDLRGKARDIDLPPLSPYAIKYAGYGIEKGKLSFDVHYQVEAKRLTAENHLTLDQLTFDPKHVDSPTATKLPVLLAVALLKNSRGVIDIRLPISGSLDDPQFSVGGLIVQVIVNLITKAVTAPFALLSAAFGHGEELSVIAFAPGESVPGPGASARLDTLGKALVDRPALRIDVAGRADPVADRNALQRKTVNDELRREKMKSLAARGEAPASVEQVTIGDDERAAWLTSAYRDSSLPDRPRNAFGVLESVPPAQMEAMLLAAAKVDDDALRRLANARAQAVKDALESRKVAGERIFIAAPQIGAPPSSRASAPAGTTPAAPEAPASRVDLALR